MGKYIMKPEDIGHEWPEDTNGEWPAGTINDSVYIPPEPDPAIAIIIHHFTTLAEQSPVITAMSILSDAMDYFAYHDDEDRERLSETEVQAIAIWFERMYNTTEAED